MSIFNTDGYGNYHYQKYRNVAPHKGDPLCPLTDAYGNPIDAYGRKKDDNKKTTIKEHKVTREPIGTPSKRPSSVKALITKDTYIDAKTGKKGEILEYTTKYIIVKFPEDKLPTLIDLTRRFNA